MTLSEAIEIARDAQNKADALRDEAVAMAVRRARMAEYRLALEERKVKGLTAQLEEAWVMLAKVTDANPNT